MALRTSVRHLRTVRPPSVIETCAIAASRARPVLPSRSLSTLPPRVHQPVAGPSRLPSRPEGGRRHASAFNGFVQTSETPNADALKFLPGVAVTAGGSTHEFLTATSALPSPLASSLFDIDGVKTVFFGPDFVSITKDAETGWALMKPEIFSVLIEHFTAGKPLFREGNGGVDEPQDTKILETDSETVAQIKELLDTRVRPAIQEDGGDLEYHGFTDTGTVQLSLKGSCRGCDSSTVTLKSGIERMLMHYVPEVKAVEQIIPREESIAIDAFEKFEQRLRGEGKTVDL